MDDVMNLSAMLANSTALFDIVNRDDGQRSACARVAMSRASCTLPLSCPGRVSVERERRSGTQGDTTGGFNCLSSLPCSPWDPDLRSPGSSPGSLVRDTEVAGARASALAALARDTRAEHAGTQERSKQYTRADRAGHESGARRPTRAWSSSSLHRVASAAA
jgi:hypothetical protein